MTTTEQLTPVDGLMLRAGMYQMLALGYSYPGTEQRQRIQELSAGLAPWLGQVRVDLGERTALLGDSLEEAVAQTNEAPERDNEGDLAGAMEAEFNVLFSGAMAAAPFETAYERDIFRKQHALADISGFYLAFGFQVAEGSRWQPDHVGVQLEYCSVVLQRTAHAQQQGLVEQSEICVDALRKFLTDHLGRWSAALASDVDRTATLPFYQGLAALTRDWLDLEIQALELEPDLLSSRHVSADDSELPTCGGCTGCGPDGPEALAGPGSGPGTAGLPCPGSIE